MKKILLFCMMLLSVTGVYARRTDRSYVRRGNRLYNDSLFIKAEENYLKALDVNPDLYEGNYNLGNAYTAQQNPNDAVKRYMAVSDVLEAKKKELMADPSVSKKELEKCKAVLAKTYHNTGVVYHMCERYKEAVEAYKEALRNNPQDDETRYNMILAQRMLKEQQDQQQDQQQEQQDNQQQDQQQDQQQQEEEQRQQQQEQQDMSQENAEQILEAAMQDEKGIQERVMEQLMNAQPKKPLEKDW